MEASNRHTGRAPSCCLRTLVVDDSFVVAQSLRNYLEADGRFKVVSCASNGRLAVELVAQLQPDVVLMDVQMPEMDGLEATRRIKSRRPAPTVLIVTLDDTPCCRAAANAAGADGFISKTALSTELPRALASLPRRGDVAGRPPASGAAAVRSPRDPPER